MIIRSNLFSKSPLTREASLRDILEAHRKQTIASINAITDLSRLTEGYLERLVKDSLVTPVAIAFDRKRFKLRQETIDISDFPSNSLMGRRGFDRSMFPEETFQKHVGRQTVPFTGDPAILQFAPAVWDTRSPMGQVKGNEIEFDVVIFDDEHAKQEALKNLELIKEYADRNNQQVKAFNESLPESIKGAFATKLEALKQQYSAFNELGIVENEQPDDASYPAVPERSRPMSFTPMRDKIVQPQVIITIVQNFYVNELNQFNYNSGDVNNAIQSNEQ